MRPASLLLSALLLAAGATAAAADGDARLVLDFERGRVVDDDARQGARLDGLPPRARAAAGAAPQLGLPVLQFEGGHAGQRRAAIVDDPARPGNHVLEFRVMEPNVQGADIIGGRKGRVQMNVYGSRGAAEMYTSVRMRLDEGFDGLAASPEAFDWLTLSEWWNNAGWTREPNKFRITVDLTNRGPDGRAGLYLHVKATAMPVGARRWSEVVWTRASGLALPVKQWVTVETWVREGDDARGRFVMAVTPDGGARQVAVDVTGFTHHPEDRQPDGFAHVNPLKLYTSQSVIDHARRSAPALSVQWDDLRMQACAAVADGAAGSDCSRAIGSR